GLSALVRLVMMTDNQLSTIRKADYYLRNYIDECKHLPTANRKSSLNAFAKDFANGEIDLELDELPWRVRKCLEELYPTRFPLPRERRKLAFTHSDTPEDEDSGKAAGIPCNKGHEQRDNLSLDSADEANEIEAPQESSKTNTKDVPRSNPEGPQNSHSLPLASINAYGRDVARGDSNEAAEGFLDELGQELWGAAYTGSWPSAQDSPVEVDEQKHMDSKDSEYATAPPAPDPVKEAPQVETAKKRKRRQRGGKGRKVQVPQGDSAEAPL
ncbi:MAG: hypothetical protein Q9183_007068, partial [Haloplaca sp. 2 TL-2023]